MRTVMVVEDDPAIRRLLDVALDGGERYRVILAADGPEALRRAAAETVDLVLLDVGLPGLDGYAVCESLRASLAARASRILMLTARCTERDRERARTSGADGFVAKPFSPAALRARVESELESSREAACIR